MTSGATPQPAPPRKMADVVEQIRDGWETLRVKWLLLDAQSKQVILLAVLYLSYTLLDVAGALAKVRLMTAAEAR